MGKVVQMQKVKYGEEFFPFCSCTPESQYIPLLMHDPKMPIVIALVCDHCERTLRVENGIVQPDEDMLNG